MMVLDQTWTISSVIMLYVVSADEDAITPLTSNIPPSTPVITSNKPVSNVKTNSVLSFETANIKTTKKSTTLKYVKKPQSFVLKIKEHTPPFSKSTIRRFIFVTPIHEEDYGFKSPDDMGNNFTPKIQSFFLGSIITVIFYLLVWVFLMVKKACFEVQVKKSSATKNDPTKRRSR